MDITTTSHLISKNSSPMIFKFTGKYYGKFFLITCLVLFIAYLLKITIWGVSQKIEGKYEFYPSKTVGLKRRQ